MKGRGAVAEARTRKHRGSRELCSLVITKDAKRLSNDNEVRSAAWSARVERTEGFLIVVGRYDENDNYPITGDRSTYSSTSEAARS